MENLPKTMEELKQAVLIEVQHIKSVVTKEELDTLESHYNKLNPKSRRYCIYGALTDNFCSVRAREIYPKSLFTPEIISDEVYEIEDIRPGYSFTAMECYILIEKDMIFPIADFILGKTQHLELK